MVEYISSTYGSDASANKDIVENQSSSIANHIQNETGIDTDSWNFGELPFEGGDKSDEFEFGDDALKYILNNKVCVDREVVLIGHSVESWGYGRSGFRQSKDGKTIYGSIVYIGTAIADWEKKIMSWHEIAHTYGPDHKHGNWDLINEHYENISPVSASYVWGTGPNGNYVCDMPFCGQGDVPDTDCDSDPNHDHLVRADLRDIHEFPYSDCTMNQIESWY